MSKNTTQDDVSFWRFVAILAGVLALVNTCAASVTEHEMEKVKKESQTINAKYDAAKEICGWVLGAAAPKEVRKPSVDGGVK